ncbi:MAG: hypothetical protein K0Q79_3727 [Flavipsychrobacter sp.]|nr:hypothetical protein [Flavipsychrobacter sp.]
MLLFLSNCVTKKRITEGAYRKDFGKGGPGAVYTLIIYPEDTFTYSWHYCLTSGVTKGHYKKNRKSHIVLNGGKPHEQPNVFEGIKGSRDSVYVEVTDFSNRPIPIAVVYLNDSGITADIEGKVAVKKVGRIQRIEIKHHYFNIKYPVQKSTSNYFLIKGNTSFKDEVYFKDVGVRIKSNKLIRVCKLNCVTHPACPAPAGAGHAG